MSKKVMLCKNCREHGHHTIETNGYWFETNDGKCPVLDCSTNMVEVNLTFDELLVLPSYMFFQAINGRVAFCVSFDLIHPDTARCFYIQNNNGLFLKTIYNFACILSDIVSL